MSLGRFAWSSAALLAIASASDWALPAEADEVFLTEAQAPAALFGEGARGERHTLELDDVALAQVSRAVGKRLEVRSYPYFAVSRGGAPLGLVLLLEVVGQNLPIQFAVGVRGDGTLQDLQVMVYREPYGKEINQRRFRAQFNGKSGRDPLTIGKDLDAISGASISSVAAAYAAKKALALAEVVRGQGAR